MPKVFIQNMINHVPKNKIHELIQTEWKKLDRKLYNSKPDAVRAITTAYQKAVMSYSGRAVIPSLGHYEPDEHSEVFHIETCYMHLIEVNEKD